MDWIALRDESALQEIIDKSATRPQVIFKHSIRCGISAVAKGRLDRASTPSEADFYYLDLVNHRGVSNKVSALFNVEHQSPQVLVIRDGACVYDESHMGIQMKEILGALS